MATETAGTRKQQGIDWGRAEFILFGLAIVSLVTILIKLNKLWSGLPAHPLIIHVPVIMIPLAVLGALVLTVRPAWFDRYGSLVCLVAIVGMSSIFLAENAGGALQSDLHLTGRAATLINQHSSAANVLAILFAGFTAVMIFNFAAYRIGGGRPTGLTPLDGVFASPSVRLVLRVLLVVLALVSAYYVYRVGDLGAKAVWQSRLQGPPHRI
jgi:hypothetical protein